MTLQSVLASVNFELLNAGSVSLATRDSINSAITSLYASATGRSLLETAARRGLLNFTEFTIQRQPTQFDIASSTINVNLAQVASLRWFNAQGVLVEASFDLVLIHEIKHAVGVNYASDPGSSVSPYNSEFNATNWLTDGPAVRAQNQVARELGRTSEIRISYFGTQDVRQPDFALGLDRTWTDNLTIDSVRLAVKETSSNGTVQILDERLHGAQRNLIIGWGGVDQIFGGAGTDFLYGMDGDDLIFGGDGQDRIYGGIGNDGLSGERGDDRIFGGTGNDALVGGLGNDLLHGGDRVVPGDPRAALIDDG